jgi:hypothetical protein
MATAGKILMFPVGNWTSGNNYGFLDIVYYGGSSYIAKTDITNSTTNPVADTANWQILAHGYIADTLSGIDGIDTSGLLGTAGETVSSQTLIDKIADMVADKLVLKTAISNQQINDSAKVTGSALAYSMGQSIDTLNSNLNNQTITSSGLNLTWGSVNSGGYTVIGNIVIINIRIAINTSLSAGTEYLISGFPSPKGLSANSIAVSCSHHSLTAICYLGAQGLLSFNPSSAISSGTSLFFSAFYIKQ